jgi:hypothetical protein
VIFVQFPEDGANDGLPEEFGLVGNFVFDAEVPDDFVFRIVKRQHLPVLSPGGAGCGLLFMFCGFHKQLSSCCKSNEKFWILNSEF